MSKGYSEPEDWVAAIFFGSIALVVFGVPYVLWIAGKWIYCKLKCRYWPDPEPPARPSPCRPVKVPEPPPEPAPDPAELEALARAEVLRRVEALHPAFLKAVGELEPEQRQRRLCERLEEALTRLHVDVTCLTDWERTQPVGVWLNFWEVHALDPLSTLFRGQTSRDLVVGKRISAYEFPKDVIAKDSDGKRDILLPLSDRKRHTYAIGRTGSGKTNLQLQLIEDSIRRGITTVVLDLRGDLVDRLLRRFNLGTRGTVDSAAAWEDDPFRAALAEKLCVIDLRYPDSVVGLNPLVGPGEVHSRAMQVLDIIRAQAEGWGVQIEHTMRNCLIALCEAEGSLVELGPLLTNAEFRHRILSRCSDENVQVFFAEFEAMAPEQQRQYVMPVLNKVQPLVAIPRLRNTLGAPNSLDWQALLDSKKGKIVLVSLAADSLHSASSLIGSLVISQITNAVFARTSIPERARRPVHLYIDEFSNFASGAFLELIAEGRRFGLSLTLAHQNCSQLDKELRESVQNNCHLQFLFSTGPVDAQALARELKFAGAGGPEELLNLRPGEAFMIRRGKNFLRIQTPLVVEPEVPQERVTALRSRSDLRYAMPRALVEEAIRLRQQGGTRQSGDHMAQEVRHGKRPTF